MARRSQPRRGVLLLIVLSLLVLFVLIGVTFIVTAGHFNRTARINARQEQKGDPPQKLLDAAMYEIVRGTSNPRSSALGHSLLEDLYGREGFRGTIKQQPNPGITQGHFLTFLFDPDDPTRFDRSKPNLIIPNNFFNGAVLTMVTGSASGQSTRIVAFTSQPRPGLKIEALEGIVPAVGDRFVVNGLPFNGTGAGYNPETGQLDALTTDGPVALMPHFAAYLDEQVVGTNLTVGPALVNGGLDESWETFDYQNVFLAKVTPGAFSSNPLQITPSFHRPFLINYWLQSPSSGFLTNPKVRRQVILRPTRDFHPSFTGSNPAFDVDADDNGVPDGLTNGPWDVDNDGDGIPDSVWIDFGLPPVAGPDGKLYKPLIAPLIVDLDGRLNLNVHGNLRQIQARGIDPNFARIETGRNTVGNVPQVELLRGNGYGPPDINLLGLFRGNPPDPLGDPATYRRLLTFRYAGANEPANAAAPGTSESITGDVDEPFSRLTHLGLQPNFAISLLSAYSTPTDLYGRGVMFLDQTGNPVWAEMGIEETTDDPYEVNLVETGPHDSLFTASDLEPILRRHDSDAASLHSRLMSDVRVMDRAVQGFDKLVTTHSFDISTPATVIPNRIRRQNATSPQSNIMEIIADRLRRELADAGLTGNQLERRVQENLVLLVPFEMQRGQKMDINRLLGNLVSDGQTDYVVDDPFEPTTPRQEPVSMPRAGRNGVSGSEYRSTLANDYPGTTNKTDGNVLRNIFARQLYALMMALTDEGFRPPADGNPLPVRERHARRIAQWAINTVEFRDADAIMTPFEYDLNPFNGWDVDGYIGDGPGADGQIGTGDDTSDEAHPERRLVWGAEHPELIITETLAFHDRRVKDEDVGGKVEPMPGEEPDLHFDQYLVPEGSLFIELYCVRGRESANPALATAKLPMGLYGPDGDDKGVNKNNPFGRPRYLQLGRMAARNVRDGNEDNTPVWRIAIQDPSREDDDTTPEVERVIWFTRRPGRDGWTDGRTYSNFQGSWPQVAPGGYVVVGPRPVTAIGYSNSPEDLPSRQRIILDPQGKILDTRGTGLAYIDADGVTRLPARPVTTIIAQANNTAGPGCSVSEPLPPDRYSPLPELDERPEVAGLGFRVPYHLSADQGGQSIDEPFDNLETAPLRMENKLETGTYENHRTALLQRLANPLMAFNPKFNPYITVDSMPIDLTVFNSLATGGADDPDDQDPEQPIPEPRFTRFGDVPPEPRKYELASRERVGDAMRLRSGFDPFRSLWNSSFTRKGTPPFFVPGNRVGTHSPRAVDDGELKDVVNLNLGHTLGELNSAFGPAVTAFRPGKIPGDPDTDTSNITNNPATARILQQLRHSFPTLVWNNRPYVSALELMLVPASSQENLLQEFTVDRSWDDLSGAAPRPNFSPYGATGGSSELDSYYGPFGHLLNFFHSSTGALTGDDDDDDSGTRKGANYSRIFDYVEVPSRFVGTRKWYNPEVFQNVPNWRTPFNNLSRFRDPGRLNINTILSPEIWRAMGGEYFLPWASFVESRQGFKSAQLANFPAEVSNPFRAASGADLVPPIEGGLLQHNVVDATLLRSDLTDADNDGNRHEPLLAPFELASEADKPYINRKRNAYSRYQAYQKLANLVTTHSNVYAVWLTVGYFELEPNYAPTDTAFANPYFVDTAHPDGYRLGLERGSDIGQVERQRAFYIIDRSIPVAFEAGVNHNVDRAVLLRRFIE